jgi:hypothetical protein|tara:strand:+ start:717 stop:902 length:186 start_codon:yes stop_codon:yes gene_type:complete
MEEKYINLLAECSTVNGEQTLTEADIRDMVGAPDPEEEKYCLCGELLSECDEGYVHMTSGC